MADRVYDAVIVGAGHVGALVAKVLTDHGKDVLLLEAGRASGLNYRDWQSYVEYFYTALPKVPNSPYPQNANAPFPMATDAEQIARGTPDLVGYQVEKGPLPYGSTYLRSLGGTSLHWLGTCPRMVPNDFRMKSLYGVGVDWPITYDDLQEYYCRAEWMIGVSGNKEDQEHFGITFPKDYNYPMERIPQSYSDQVVSEKVRNLSVEIYGKKYPVWVASLAQARNSIPRKGYTPIGAPGAPEVGLRCEGNANCIPICPVHAKYTALKTIGRLDAKHTTLVTQAVATRVLLDGNGRVSGIEYKRYQDESSPVCETLTAKGTIYILAAHAIETAKLLLASGAANSSDQVGRNLMDHPWFYTWALAPMDLGMFRGPAMTSGIPSFRDGPFRTEFAAFRIDVGNWAWDVATFPPDSNVNELAAKNVFGAKLRKKLGDTIPRQLRLGMVTEQLPDPGNRVTISPEYTDAIGAYRPVLHYNIADYTRLSFVNAIRISNAIYRAMGIGPDDIKTHFSNASPMYMTYRMPNGKVIDLSCIGSGHHMGTHRMGVSRTDSVVNRYQRSWDHENLFLVGCGSMPTSGSSNPTITAAAMALMATDEMLRDLR